MSAPNRKLPDNDILARDVAQGMSLSEIARRYNATKDVVRRHLKAITPSPFDRPTAKLVEDDRRIVIERRVTAAEFGGSTTVRISLPRVSMHLAARATP